jgi:hypothetical protein
VLSYLKRFGSVTVLNEHIHACSTAFPQPYAGQADSGSDDGTGQKPNDLFGVTNVNFARDKHTLAIVDASLNQ